MKRHEIKQLRLLVVAAAIRFLQAVGILVLTSCSLEPRGTAEERTRLGEAGHPYRKPLSERDLPELPGQPDWGDVLQRAFLANGDLEAAYFEWKAAVSRIDIASAYPNTNITLGFDYMFSKEQMKAWDRTTLSVGFDPMAALQLPPKVAQAARVSLDAARAAGKRFEAAKFGLQQKVLTAYWEYALIAEKRRIQWQNLNLLQSMVDTTAPRVQAGAPQQDLIKVQTEYELSRNEYANTESELASMRAMLNGMLARPAKAVLLPPAVLPPPRPVADDSHLIAVAVDNNPELAALAQDVVGRADALELARLAYLPDITPQFSATGNISQMVGAMITLPTAIPQIQAMIEESKAMLRATEAMTRQARSERGASFVATLYALRNSERQVALFRDVILPQVEQLLASSTQAYSAGQIEFADLIDSQRILLDARLMVAEARAAREKRLAELEALAGVDIEMIGTQSDVNPPVPAGQPAAEPAP